MGAFDDLIPSAAGSSPAADPFADLIPAESNEGGFLNAAGNIVRGAGERAMDMAGGFVRSVAGGIEAAGDFMERQIPLGTIDTDNGIRWRPQTEEEIAAPSRLMQTGSRVAGDLAGVEFGYKPGTTWEDVKDSPLRNFIPFAIEQGLVSTPDMAAALVNLPGYVVARTGEIAQERAKNDAVENARVEDLIKALPASAASALFERIGARGMFGLDEAAGTILARGMKAGVKEGVTEGAQEGVEYLGSNLGTKAGVDPAQMGEQMLAGAVAGGTFGAAVGTGVAAGERVAGRRIQQTPAGEATEADPFSDLVPEGAQPAEAIIGADPEATQLPRIEVDGTTGETTAEIEKTPTLTPPEPVAASDPDPERLNSPRLTPEDRASPIPNDIIDDGKAILDAALAGTAPTSSPETLTVASAEGAPVPPAPAALPASSPAPTPAPASSIVGEEIDGDWVRFKPESGTLNIPRAEMPQVKAENRGPMVNFLNARGVTHQEEEVAASTLKPTQAEFSRTKVKEARSFKGGDRAILVSADGHILDGTHQWLAKLPGNSAVRIIRLNAPISDLIPLVREFPSSTLDTATAPSREITPEFGRDATTAPIPATPAAESAPTRAAIARRDLEADTAVTANGRSVPVQYAIVEASSLTPSQRDDGGVNPDYPADLQPRDRSRAVSQAQIQSISRSINPRLLDKSPRASDGAPIISPDGVVESGNGRVLAIRQAYSAGRADSYRDYLAEKGYPVDGVSQPVLVRVRTGDLTAGDRQAFTREANERDTLAMSATEQAMADASALSPAMVALYRGGDVDQTGNRDFVRAFIRDVVNPNDQARMISADGALSQEAIRRVQGGLLAKAYSDPDLVATLIESPDTNIKSIGGAVLDVAPEWAQMRDEARSGAISADADQTTRLLEAIRTVDRARREGKKIADLVGQRDIFSGEAMNPTSEGFLRLMFRNNTSWTMPVGREKLAEALRFYVAEMRKTSAGVDLLGQSAVEPGQVLDIAKGKIGEAGSEAAGQATLFGGQAVAPRAGEDVRPSGGERAVEAEPAKPAQGRGEGEGSGDGRAGEVEPSMPTGFELTLVRLLDPREIKEGVGSRGEFKAVVVSRSPYGVHDAIAASRAAAIRKALDRAQKFVGKGPASSYGSSNKLFTDDAAAKARETLRQKFRSQLSAGLDPELVQAGITLAGYHIEAGARSFAAYTAKMIEDLGVEVRPYLRSWYEGVRYYPGMNTEGMTSAADIDNAASTEGEKAPASTGETKPAPIPGSERGERAAARQRDYGTASSPNVWALGQAFAEYFAGATKGFDTIVRARAFAAELVGGKIEPGTPAAKKVDEAVEVGVVLAARAIVDTGRERKADPKAIFDRLVDLYGRQPSLNVRTSTSVADQAYSTPAPLAFLASELAGIDRTKSVLEPSAGTGMLLIGANPSNATANEINPERAIILREQSVNTKQLDAAEYELAARQTMDAVIANPPFGVVRDDRGNTKRFDVDFQYSTNEIDHAIAMNALKAMKLDGSAVLILGGINKLARTEEARSDAYNGKAKREFYFSLYGAYNVVDHFTVAGELYAKQGAGWPVDVIVIRGTGKSQRALPAADVPRVLSTWDEVRSVLDEERIEGTRADSGQAVRSSGTTADGGTAADDGRTGDAVRGAGTSGAGRGGGDQDGRSAGVQRGSDRGERDGRAEDRPAARSGDADAGRQVAAADGGRDLVAELSPQDTAARQWVLSQGRLTGFEHLIALDGDKREVARFKGTRSSTGMTPELMAMIERPGSNLTIHHNHPSSRSLSNTDIAYMAFPGLTKVYAHGNNRSLYSATLTEAGRKFAGGRPILAVGQDIDLWMVPLFVAGDEMVREATVDINEMNAVYHHMRNQALADGGLIVYETTLPAPDFFGSAELKAGYDEAVANVRRAINGGNDRRSVPVRADAGAASVRGGDAVAPVRPAAEPEPDAGTETATRTQRVADRPVETEAAQVPYRPRSGGTSMGTLIPVNMQTAIDDALEALAASVGDIDAFVAKELGYTREELSQYLAAEQVDGVALAIDNFRKNAGLVIGDQTGIGKGRQVAAVLRWAMRNGKTPIFVTEKPNLYADMYRDLTDIGIAKMLGRDLRMFMTNAGETVPLTEDGSVALKSPGTALHRAAMKRLQERGSLGDEFDIIFTTYAQMQTVGGAETDRMRFLRDMVKANGVIVLDESHNAGGGGAAAQRGPVKKDETGKVIPIMNRANFVREMVQAADAVLYSSATYAKRPDVMDLYAKTDMRLAVKDIGELGNLIARGGVPMQQIVAAMLSRAGQYVRRERSFDGVVYDTPSIPVDRQTYSRFSTAIKQIQLFSETYVGEATKSIDKEAKAEGKQIMSDGSTGGAGAASTNFTAVMHNVINQMLLSITADNAADLAIESLRNGEKPVITLASTLESFIDEYAEAANLNVGDGTSISFNDLLLRYLERSRWITIKKPFAAAGETERRRLTDEELGSAGTAAFNSTKKLIEQTDFRALPVSPIDWIRSRIKAAGYSVGEITGRAMTLDYQMTQGEAGELYTGGQARIGMRPGADRSIAGRRKAISDFNSGKLDVMILNQAGSTGLSLHASERVKDKRKRHMIIAQAEGNIDTHMQMLGRVHRTGQVVTPRYSQLVADIPAVKRPASVLAKKMASLNATTTASRDSALTSKDTPDFMNEYGDKVAAAVMLDNPDMHMMLGSPLKPATGGYETEGAMRKVTGRIPLMPVETQEQLYDMLESEYVAFLAQMEAAGENALEAKTLNLDARTIETREIRAPGADGGPFSDGVYFETVDVKMIGRPMKSAEVLTAVADEIGVAMPSGTVEQQQASLARQAAGPHQTRTNKALSDFRAFRQALVADIEDPAKVREQETKFNDLAARWRAVMDMAVPGEGVVLKTDALGNLNGVVIAVQQTGKAKNPLALGSWKVKVALADASRQMTVPFSQLFTDRTAPAEMADAAMVIGRSRSVGQTPTIRAFDEMQGDRREERVIVTGNILAGYEEAKGRGAIINFTDSDGRLRQGILMSRKFDMSAFLNQKPVALTTGDQVREFIKRTSAGLYSTDRMVGIRPLSAGGFMVTTDQSRDQGGKYYLNRAVLDAVGRDFVRVSDEMRAEVPASRISGVVDALMRAGASFAADSDKALAREITGAKDETLITGRANGLSEPEFRMSSEPWSAAERQQAMQGFIAKGQPIDRALRLPFAIFGGVDAKGEWKPGKYLSNQAAKIITDAKFGPESPFAWLNGPLHTARAGLIDRYGLPADYVERDRKRTLDERAVMMQGAEVLKTLKEQKVDAAEAKVLQAMLTGEDVDVGEMAKLAAPIRQAIDEMGSEAAALGLISMESYERNRGAYLHRVYAKHEIDQNALSKMVGRMMGRQRKKIIGDELKMRGLVEKVDMARLTASDPEWKGAQRGRPVKGEKFKILDRVQADMMGGRERTMHRVYWPADRPVPAAYAAFTDKGTWEIRGEEGGKAVLWRDYTKAEREKMGEILDARYTIGKTFMLMAHDLATGRFYKDIAENEEWSKTSVPEGTARDASEVGRYVADENVLWVKVPTTEIADTGGKKRWGALAGRYVRAEIWRDLNEIEVMSQPTWWRTIMTQWKLNKTARSPVVHMNNVISNMIFMDQADVRAQDLVAGIRSYARGDRDYREAAENGAFGSDMISQEIRDQVLKPILEEIAADMQGGASNPALGRAKMLGRLADRIWTWAKAADRKMLDAYRIEDEVFRMATYQRRRVLGDDPKQAADFARQQFLDYDIRAPWVNAARNSVLPFISYTYRAVPVLAKSIATRPWKMAKYFMVAYMANALAYLWDDEGDEEKERASLREEEQGKNWFGVPRMMRMPWRSEDGLPVFLDVRRWVPAGDIFDTGQGSSALPIPAPLQFGGPLMLATEVFYLNKSAFTGQEITNELTDTEAERAAKVGDYLWKAWMPSAAWVPGSWYWEKIANAATGATDASGRPYDLPSAISSSVGIKLKPQDVDAGLEWRGYELRKVEQELKTQARRLGRQRERGLISQKAYEQGIQAIMDKGERLSEKARALEEASQ